MGIIGEFESLLVSEFKKNVNYYDLDDCNFTYDRIDVADYPKISLYDDMGNFIKSFYNLKKALKYLNGNFEDYSIRIFDNYDTAILQASNKVFSSLRYRGDFSNQQLSNIIKRLALNHLFFYKDTFDFQLNKFARNLYQAESSCKLFFDNFEFSLDLIVEYYERKLDKLLCKEDYQYTSITTLNDLYRENYLTILNYMKSYGTSYNDICMFLEEYLTSNYSLKNFDGVLYDMLFENEAAQLNFKKYIVILIIYDFYSLNYQKNNSYDDYINKYSLKEIYLQFMQNDDFRKTVIRSFIGSFMIDDLLINKEIFDKFKPISTLDLIKKNK